MFYTYSLMFKIFLLVAALSLAAASQPVRVQGFEELAKEHCKAFPVETIWRLATGHLSQIYGGRFKQYDAYIRKFVGYDNQDNPYFQEIQKDQDSEEQEGEQEQVKSDGNDYVVEAYTKGLKSCGLNWQPKEVYAIWRFVRFVVNSDYLYEWLRTEMRGHYGYQIQKPNAWMDGQTSAERLRLQKLFSNAFLDELEGIVFREFMYPIMTTLKKNTVVAVSSTYSKSGFPMIMQTVDSRNYEPDCFFPVLINIDGIEVFSYTLPGLPLLLTGSTQNLAWAFTGILVDRTNVQTLEISKYKYFDQNAQRWIKVKNITTVVKVKGEEDYIDNYYWTQHGPLFRSPGGDNKREEYIRRWRQNQPQVRTLFSKMVQLIKNPTSKPNLYFPFNSLVMANNEGIHHCLLIPQHPAYFIYADLLGQAKVSKPKWASNPRRGFYVVSNKHLSSMNPQGYLQKEVFSVSEEMIIDTLRKWKDNKKLGLSEFVEEIRGISYDPYIRKIANLLMLIYRKAKFSYIPQDTIRKQCDQLVALLQKWDYSTNHPVYSSIFKLWWFYTRKYTFTHISASQLGKYLARLKAVTDTYFVGQIDLWKEIVGYGQCDNHQYHRLIEQHVNHTGHNATCFYNIIKALNSTRIFLKKYGQSLLNTQLKRYDSKITWNLLDEGYTDPLFTDKDLAFQTTFNTNLVFAADLSGELLHSHGLQPSLDTYFHKGVKGEKSRTQESEL